MINRHQKFDSGPKEMADILNAQYQSVFTKPSPITNTISPDPNIPCIADLEITEEKLKIAMEHLSPDSAPGEDRCPSFLLHNYAKQLAKPLKLIWQKSFDTGILPLPEGVVTSLITPVYKGDDKSIAKNYRPIALTSHIMKTFERVVKEHILDHLLTNNLLNESQHGFRPGRSTLTQLLPYYDSILHMLETQESVDSIYLDFAKAFDKVDHNILLSKLAKLNITGKIHTWISAFLKNRKQTVVIDNCRSERVWVTSGVPQGSVLGPLLFLIMMSDFTDSLKSARLGSFADDTRVWHPTNSDNMYEYFQSDLDIIYKWAEENKMQFIIKDIKRY